MAEESELDARCITAEPARCQFELRLCSELFSCSSRATREFFSCSRATRHGEFFS